MSLRPRYSLLTFLLFTAAVAVGIKLWRGPHNVVLTNPTAGEMQDLTHIPLSPRYELFRHYGVSKTYEYIYQNTWGGRELLTLQENYTEPRPLLRQIEYQKIPFFHLSWSIPEYAVDRPAISYGEAICWISGKLEPVSNESFSPENRPAVGGAKWLRWMKDRQMYGPAYLLTTRKEIFRTKLYDFNAEYFEKIELDDISDIAVRNQVQAIFAALPGS